MKIEKEPRAVQLYRLCDLGLEIKHDNNSGSDFYSILTKTKNSSENGKNIQTNTRVDLQKNIRDNFIEIQIIIEEATLECKRIVKWFEVLKNTDLAANMVIEMMKGQRSFGDFTDLYEEPKYISHLQTVIHLIKNHFDQTFFYLTIVDVLKYDSLELIANFEVMKEVKYLNLELELLNQIKKLAQETNNTRVLRLSKKIEDRILGKKDSE